MTPVFAPNCTQGARTRTFRAALLVLGLTLLPAAAFGQASIAGVVKDSSGAAIRARVAFSAEPFVVGRTTQPHVAQGDGAARIAQVGGVFAPPRRLSVNRGFG